MPLMIARNIQILIPPYPQHVVDRIDGRVYSMAERGLAAQRDAFRYRIVPANPPVDPVFGASPALNTVDALLQVDGSVVIEHDIEAPYLDDLEIVSEDGKVPENVFA